MDYNISDLEPMKKKIIDECRTMKGVTPTGVDVLGLRNYYIFLSSELDMYRIWDMYLTKATKGYSLNLKTWYVHVIVD